MRRIRPLLVAGTLVLAVGIGSTVALITRQEPTATAAAPAGQPAASPTAAATSDPATSPIATTPKTPDTPDRGDEARAVAPARAPAPRILAVTTSPRLPTLEGGFWIELPPGAGTVVFSVKATNTQRVRFTLTPTGTDMGGYGKLLGEDRDPSDGFSLVWRYPNEPLSAHLSIQATGPGGATDKLFGIAHPDV